MREPASEKTALKGLVQDSKRSCRASLAGPVWGADAHFPTPPPYSNVDANGVDVVKGTFSAAQPSISIGPPTAGLSYGRVWVEKWWRDTITPTLEISGSLVTVGWGGGGDTFTVSGSTYTSAKGNGATLTKSGSLYTYTDRDGVRILFDASYFNPSTENTLPPGHLGLVTEIRYANGHEIKFHRTSVTVWFGDSETGRFNTFYRVQSITDNYGYQLRFWYQSNDFIISDPGIPFPWTVIASVWAINNAVDACAPTSYYCAPFTQDWPSLTYDDASITVTDSLSNEYKYETTFVSGVPPIGAFRLSKITLPSGQTTTVTYDTNGRVSSVNDGLGTWTYNFAPSGGTMTTTITSPVGDVRQVYSSIAVGRPTTDRNGAMETTSYLYDGYNRTTRVTQPEGNYTAFVYDGRGNVTQRTSVSKTPGTPANIVVSASYDVTCLSRAKCNKPNSVTVNGQTTNYEYDSTHGGMTKMTLPAPVTSGIRPELRYSYSALYAWSKNPAGTLVQAATPIYLPTATATCQTLASCAGTADEVRTGTVYEAGSSAVKSNLLPLSASAGSGDGALTATTAFAYDHVGNVLAVDGPLPGTDDTTRFTYDAVRQQTMTIGPDPDGGGLMRNRALRTSYNADGQPQYLQRGVANADGSGFHAYELVAMSYGPSGLPSFTSRQSDGVTRELLQYGHDAAGRLACTAQRMNPAAFAAAPSACDPGAVGAFGPDRIEKRAYDAAGRLTLVQSAYGVAGQQQDAAYSYTANGLLATVEDGEQNRTSYEYDGLDRLSRTFFPDKTLKETSSTSDYEELSYDAASNIVARRLRDGTSIGFTYDQLNRLTQKDLPGAELDIGYSYDNLGRPTSATQYNHALTFSYDALSRRIAETGPRGTIRSGYDLAGRRTRLTWPDGFYVAYDYNLANEMTAVRENGATSGFGVLATFAWDDLGRRKQLARGNGTVTSYSYDNAGRLSGLGQDFAGTASDVALSFDAYSPAGQIGRRAVSNDAYAPLSSAMGDLGYTANGLNQYVAVGAVTPGYDARGNLTSLGGASYLYSSENLLIFSCYYNIYLASIVIFQFAD